jgi:hypothetical protein
LRRIRTFFNAPFSPLVNSFGWILLALKSDPPVKVETPGDSVANNNYLIIHILNIN